MIDFSMLVMLIACCAVNRQALIFLIAHALSIGITSSISPSIDVVGGVISGAVVGSTLSLIAYSLICFSCVKRNLAIASFMFASIFFIDAILNQLHFEGSIDYTKTFIFSEFSPSIFGVGMNFTGWQCIMLTIDLYIIYLLIANERRHALYIFNSTVNILRVRIKNTHNFIVCMFPSSEAVIHKNKKHIEKNS